MRLDEIVHAAYTLTLPVRALDKTVRLKYDAFAAATGQFGFDRYRLAKGAGFVAAISLGVASHLTGTATDLSVPTAYDILSLFGVITLPPMADKMRQYNSLRQHMSDEWPERFLNLTKFARYALLIGVPVNLALKVNGIISGDPISFGEVTLGIGYFAFMSYCYLISGGTVSSGQNKR